MLLRQAYLARELPYEVALVTLDLAALWAEQGRFEEVVELAAASAALFASLHLDREVLAAIASISEAAQARGLDLARLRGTRRALELAVPSARARSRGVRP